MNTGHLLSEIISCLEDWAPPVYQESYDNSGLLTGDKAMMVHKALIALDCTEEVVDEAIHSGCQLIIAHHPVIFKGLKKLTGQSDVERTVIKAIRNNIALYALHTNLDNVITGVNMAIADRLGISALEPLEPRKETLCKLYVYVPVSHLDTVRDAVFAAGAGHIGNYDQAGFTVTGKGTFRGNEMTNPFLGKAGLREEVDETRLEVIFPIHRTTEVHRALLSVHPYEEPAYDIVRLQNIQNTVGSGCIGILQEAEEELDFLHRVKKTFSCPVIRHSPLRGKKVKRIAVCGGAGSFLIPRALAAGADIFLTADLKYHEFFQAENRLILADLGHFESEQYTSDLIFQHISKKIPTFALLLSKTITNPVKYL